MNQERELNAIGAAELAVGQFVYRRIEKLMDAKADTPEGRELDYLADLVGNVEEYGAQGNEDGEQWFARHWTALRSGGEGWRPDEAWLDEVEDFLDDYSDAEIIDGTTHPNKAMHLLCQLREGRS